MTSIVLLVVVSIVEFATVHFIREEIEINKVKPQFTSKMGLYKYCPQYVMAIHNGAAMIIARRAYKYKEKVPKILKDRLIQHRESFNQKSEWARWSIINNTIKKKGGEKPDFGLANRKQILGKV